jgi:HPt (histidine-containing phosphotransfer) domain-containing protein
VLDWKLALSRVDGDENLLMDLARLFCDECERMLSTVQEAAENNDCTALQRAAHSLKGSVAAFGAQNAVDAALKVERLARSEDLQGRDEIVATLTAEVKQLRTALEDALREYTPTLEPSGANSRL